MVYDRRICNGVYVNCKGHASMRCTCGYAGASGYRVRKAISRSSEYCAQNPEKYCRVLQGALSRLPESAGHRGYQLKKNSGTLGVTRYKMYKTLENPRVLPGTYLSRTRVQLGTHPPTHHGRYSGLFLGVQHREAGGH